MLAVIRGKVDLRSVLHFYEFNNYDGPVHMGYKKLVRVDHSANEFCSRTIRGNHSNGQLARHGLLGVR